MTARWQSFLTLIPYLTPYWQVFALDFRGHGRSSWMPGHYEVEDYASDVLSFLKDQVSEPAFLFGHSLGGRVAMDLAMTSPDLVRAVVVGDTPLSSLSARGGSDDGFVKTFGHWRKLLESGLPLFPFAHALGDVPARPGPDGNPRHFKDFWDQTELLFTAQCLQMGDPDVLTHVSERRSDQEFDLLDRLSDISCPVLFLQGNPAYGALLSDADLATALHRGDQSVSVTISGTGHGLHREEPVTVAKAVHSFFCSIS